MSNNKKMELTMVQIMAAVAALDMILQQKGIPAVMSYWLKRNLENLKPKSRVFGESVSKRFNELAKDAPSYPFVPPEKYQEFKYALSSLWEKILRGTVSTIEKDMKEVQECLRSFETASKKGQKVMDRADLERFNEETNKEASELKEEVAYFPIVVDERLDAVLSSLPGSVLGDIWWMVEGFKGPAIHEASEEEKL